MVNLHQWLKRTSPHFVLAGSLMISGLSGCRSTQTQSVPLESPDTIHSPHSPAYPAPLKVPKLAPYTEAESDTASLDSDESREVVLEPPAPPAAASGSTSATGAEKGLADYEPDSNPFEPSVDPIEAGHPPRVPLPENISSNQINDEEKTSGVLVKVEPLNAVPDDAAESGNSTSDPFDESSLFPEDSVADEGTVSVSDAVSQSDRSEVNEEVANPTAAPPLSDFEPTIANQEVPVPGPVKNTARVDETDGTLEVNGPTTLQSEAEQQNEETDQSSAGTSSLFPPSNDSVELPEIEPRTNDDSAERIDNEEAALLPDITSAIVVENIKRSTPVSLPMPAGDSETQDQLASIEKTDIRSGRSDSVSSRPSTRPLFPVSPSETSTRSDGVTVVAQVWSTARSVVFDETDNAFVSHGKHISKVLPDGTVEPWATMSSPRGQVILSDGRHLVCDAGQRAVVELNSDGEQIRKVVTRSDGDFLRAPSSLVADSKGGFYFTDPGYARIRNAIGRIHYVSADESVQVVAQHLAFPEGIAFSADGSRLFVVESQAEQIVEFEILSPGVVGPKRVFARLAASIDRAMQGFPTGIVVDPKSGNVFVAHGEGDRIEVLSPTGEPVDSFELGTTVNGVAFKDNEFSRLFATGGSGNDNRNAGQLFRIQISD